MRLKVNGNIIETGASTVSALLEEFRLIPERVAVEVNMKILKKAEYKDFPLRDGDNVEIVNFVGGGIMDDKLVINGIEFRSRLWVGTGKYKDFEETKKAIEASGTDVVTVAVRRVNILNRDSENLLDYIDPKKYKILPNTAGCYNVDDALRYARLAREAGISDMIKLEVIGDEKTLFPDTEGLIKATRTLVKEGFIVFPYTNDDPIVAKKLEDAGAAAVMPLGAPIGSGLGIRNPYNIKIILETVKIPVIVDAGVGTASDATVAMELGCDAVLINTGIAGAKDPIAMAEAMKHAVLAGRLAYRAGRIPKRLYATASSPIEGML
ncbi:MAG: sulfur carrier protein ThiS [Thermodesulfovibrionales bacterium]